jgi:hypothetical protein
MERGQRDDEGQEAVDGRERADRTFGLKACHLPLWRPISVFSLAFFVSFD